MSRVAFGVMVVSLANACTCNVESFGELAYQPLKNYCQDGACPSLSDRESALVLRASGAKCADANVVTSCADGHFTLEVPITGTGFDVEHFDASQRMIGADRVGGVHYGKRPSCAPISTFVYCPRR